MTNIHKTRWEARLRGNDPKFIDIMSKGASDSSGAIARIPLRDGFGTVNQLHARLIANAPALLACLQSILPEVRHESNYILKRMADAPDVAIAVYSEIEQKIKSAEDLIKEIEGES